MKVWKKSAVAAAIIAFFSVATVGLTFPTYASSIPVVGDIFRFLDNGRTGLYDDYKEYSNEMNMTKESNGIQVTINDAIYDGNPKKKKEIKGNWNFAFTLTATCNEAYYNAAYHLKRIHF